MLFVKAIWHILIHPVISLILTLIFAALALSGNLSILLSRVLLFVGWCVATVSIFHTNLLPGMNWTVGIAAANTIIFIGLAMWMTRYDVPRIVLDRYYYEAAKFIDRPQVQWWAMHVKFLNDSKSTQQHNEPANVTARITFYNIDGPEPQYLFNLYGRWADGMYPTAVTPKAAITPTTFPIGFTRDLDICLKYPQDMDCYGVNNESFESNPVDLKLEKYRLRGVHFRAEIRLRGPFLDKTFRLEFKNKGTGGGFSELRYSSVKNAWFTRLLASS